MEYKIHLKQEFSYIDKFGTKYWSKKLSKADTSKLNKSHTPYQFWIENYVLHSTNDMPAMIDYNGVKYWRKYGVYHRGNDLPAVVFPDGTRWWYTNGLRNRDNDLPAVIIFPEMHKMYYLDGVCYTPRKKMF